MMWRRSLLAISLISSSVRALTIADSLEEVASAVAFNAEAEGPDGLLFSFGAGKLHPLVGLKSL
jgi:hypothetical protein